MASISQTTPMEGGSWCILAQPKGSRRTFYRLLFLDGDRIFQSMLTIRITGIKLQTARRLLGWSLQELATRSGVNWLTIRKYESAGDYLPPASVGALDRLVSALENAGVQFDVEGAHIDRAATMKAQVAKEIDRGAAASHSPPLSWTDCSISSSQPSAISRGGFR